MSYEKILAISVCEFTAAFAFAVWLMGCKRKPNRLCQRLSLFLRAAKSSADSGQK